MQRNLNEQAEQAQRQPMQIGAQHTPLRQTTDGFIKVKDIFFLLCGNWKWLLLSLAVCLTAAYYYLRVTPNVYSADASILVKNDESNSSDELLKDLGIRSKGQNITNEIMTLTTAGLAQEVVKRLQLETEYYHPAPFHDETAYGIDLPVKLEFLDFNDSDAASLRLRLRKDSTVRIFDMTLNGAEKPGAYKFRLGQTVKTPLGRIKVTASPYYTAGQDDDLIVARRPIYSTVSSVKGRILAEQKDNRTSVIQLSFTDLSRMRAEDVLSTLVTVYNENWVKDRNQITTATTDFIKDRLRIIESELGDVDSDISDYKSRNLVVDVNAVGAQAQVEMTASESAQREIESNVNMTKYLRNYLTDGMHDKQQLPSNFGVESDMLNTQISEYNALLLQRNNHLAVSSEQNPLVMDIDDKLRTMKGTLLASIDNQLTLFGEQKRALGANRSAAAGKISASPQQEKYLLSVERQQKVKESLYLFLLQKREENELSQAFTAYNTRLLEAPTSGHTPVSPQPAIIYAAAVLLGLLIPSGLIILAESFNTAIRGRKDIMALTAPFVGELPLATIHTGRKGKGRRRREITDNVPIVRAGSRNTMNEAFRVVRTNLEFILGFEAGHHVVMLTSMNPGSGKTFICANISTALAIKGKKVVAVDLDLRKASLSAYVNTPEMGVSNYLSGQVADYRDVMVTLGELDVIPVGTIPPNPSELLFSPRFNKMIEELKAEYDYVIIDCPPVEIVADAAIISRCAEMTLFVIRAHVMDRSFLPDIEAWYREKRYPGLSIILNGTHQEFSQYGSKRYGYHRYGYHYGHYGDYVSTKDDGTDEHTAAVPVLKKKKEETSIQQ